MLFEYLHNAIFDIPAYSVDIFLIFLEYSHNIFLRYALHNVMLTSKTSTQLYSHNICNVSEGHYVFTVLCILCSNRKAFFQKYVMSQEP